MKLTNHKNCTGTYKTPEENKSTQPELMNKQTKNPT